MTKNIIINVILFIISIYLNCKWVIAIQRAIKPFDDRLDRGKRKDEFRKGIKYLLITIIYAVIVIYCLNDVR
ncbi:hypothetical protein [Clostridium sp. UBA5712]|uniref:hypothetical protein n=1 Tax=Clostridium sp. UBA5712 TaxID=1946368 RepID=UPI00321780D5